MQKFKLKGQQLRDKHIREVWAKCLTNITFQIASNPNVKSRTLNLYVKEVKTSDNTNDKADYTYYRKYHEQR